MDATFTPTIAQRARLLVAGHPLLATKRGVIPQFKIYGGATITRAVDSAGRVYRCYCAKNLVTGKFGLFISCDGANLGPPLCSGRGSIDSSGWWIGHNGDGTYAEGPISGWQS